MNRYLDGDLPASQISDLLEHLDIKKIKIKNSTARRSIYMVSNNQIYTPPAVENFRKFILEELPGSSRIP